MIARLPPSALVALIGMCALAGCGTSIPTPSTSDENAAFGKAPPGLPAMIPLNYSLYDHARLVVKLPDHVTSVGSVRGGGIEYAPATGTEPMAVWVTKGGRVWKYTYFAKMHPQ